MFFVWFNCNHNHHARAMITVFVLILKDWDVPNDFTWLILLPKSFILISHITQKIAKKIQNLRKRIVERQRIALRIFIDCESRVFNYMLKLDLLITVYHFDSNRDIKMRFSKDLF